ncbi:MAG TPA: Zn-dependent hydrolase, partial [Micromonosporaceae bacterium]
MGDGTARRGRRVAGVATGLVGAAAAAWSIKDVPAALGARPATIRSERVRRSPQFRDGKFRNTQPASTIPSGGGGKILRELLRADSHRKPSLPIPVVTPDPSPHRDGLAITWYSHASSLVEIEGRRVLLDPVWSQRCSPSAMVGPRRLHPMPLALADLP